MKDKTRDYGCINQKLTILPSKSLEISLPNSEEMRSSITFFSPFSLLAFPLSPDILDGLRSETEISKRQKYKLNPNQLFPLPVTTRKG